MNHRTYPVVQTRDYGHVYGLSLIVHYPGGAPEWRNAIEWELEEDHYLIACKLRALADWLEALGRPKFHHDGGLDSGVAYTVEQMVGPNR